MPIKLLYYPSNSSNTTGPAIMLGAYSNEDTNSFEFTTMPPAERLRRVVEYGAQLHPQYKKEFDNGVSVE